MSEALSAMARRRLTRVNCGIAVFTGLLVNELYHLDDRLRYGANCNQLDKKKVVIIGGGTAGVGVSAQLINQGVLNVTVIEPSPVHYYQPLWTLVGAGLKKKEESMILTHKMMKKEVNLIAHSVKKIKPEINQLELEDGTIIKYDFLVIAAGIQLNWTAIPGLQDSIGKEKSGVVSIYDYENSEKTWKAFEDFKGGRAIFTIPNTPIKCAGAPQKIMWLFEENSRKRNVRDKTTVELFSNGTAMFGVKKYAEMLEKLREERGVEVYYQKELIKINSKNKVATFKSLKDGSVMNEQFDILHVVPPMSSPDFIRNSKLSDKAGFVDVDQYTLQSKVYPNIFALGDCSNSPNSKTAAAIMAQAPVVVHNLVEQMRDNKLTGVYNGYGSCPLMVSENKVILAEFGYNGKILETFSPEGKFPYNLIGQDGDTQQYLFSIMKKYVFPFAYFYLYPMGHWFGTETVFRPDVTKTEKPGKSMPQIPIIPGKA